MKGSAVAPGAASQAERKSSFSKAVKAGGNIGNRISCSTALHLHVVSYWPHPAAAFRGWWTRCSTPPPTANAGCCFSRSLFYPWVLLSFLFVFSCSGNSPWFTKHCFTKGFCSYTLPLVFNVDIIRFLGSIVAAS